jgi:hypothetical protein
MSLLATNIRKTRKIKVVFYEDKGDKGTILYKVHTYLS